MYLKCVKRCNGAQNAVYSTLVSSLGFEVQPVCLCPQRWQQR